MRTSLALLAATCLSGTALAGGFELPEHGALSLARGGANSVLPRDLTAIDLNPAAMAQLPGTRLFLSYNLVNAPVRFERAPSQLAAPGESAPFAAINEDSLFPLGVFFGASSDFGLEGWNFWLGVYGPNSAGRASYDQDGAARYQITKLDLALIYYSLGVAWGQPDHVSVGATFQWAHVPISKFELVVDGSTQGSKLNAYTSNQDVLAKFDLSDPGHFSMIIGAWWRVIPELELSLSGRVIPIKLDMKGTIELKPVGKLFVDGGQELNQYGDDASISAVIPPTARFGARYRYLDGGHELFDLELNVVYEAWSMLDAYNVNIGAEVEVLARGPNGSTTEVQERNPVPALQVRKDWKDTISVRLGGSVNLLGDRMTLSAGAFYESGAAPTDYAYIDFASYDRVGVGTGLTFRFTGVDLSISYMHVFQPDVTVDEATAQGIQQRPLANCPNDCPDGASYVAANAGTFQTSFDQLGISLGLRFDEWID